MGTIKIDDGTKEYRIVNQYGKEICKVHFRPADLSLLDRYNAISESLPEVLAPLQEIALKSDGTTSDDGWDALKRAEEAVVAKFNELLDTDDIAGVFAQRRAFSTVGGRFFCEIVLLAIGEVVSEEFEKEAKATSARLGKYLPTAEEQTDAGAAADNG